MECIVRNKPVLPVPFKDMKDGQVYVNIRGTVCMKLWKDMGCVYLHNGAVIGKGYEQEPGFPREFVAREKTVS